MRRSVHKISSKTGTIIVRRKVRNKPKPKCKIRRIFLFKKRSVLYELKRDIQCVNKYMTNQYLQLQTPYALLCMCHPFYRMEFAERCLEKKMITKRQYNSLKPDKWY